MNGTGIIRRVDELGRVVIPKEIRRRLHIKDGEPLELFIEGGSIIYKKYRPLDDIATTIKEIIDEISNDDYLYFIDVMNRNRILKCLEEAEQALKERDSDVG